MRPKSEGLCKHCKIHPREAGEHKHRDRRSPAGPRASLTKGASAELAGCLVDQHLLHHIQEGPQDEDRPQGGAVHLLDPLIGQAH